MHFYKKELEALYAIMMCLDHFALPYHTYSNNNNNNNNNSNNNDDDADNDDADDNNNN